MQIGKAPSSQRTAKGLLGPGADNAFAPLVDASIRRRVIMAHVVSHTQRTVQRHIGRPLGRVLMQRWMRGQSPAKRVESFGLSRHIVEEVLGEHALTLHVDPRKLIRIGVHAPRDIEKRPSSLAFIWDGTWDQRREDLRVGTRYELISELDDNRGRLEQTQRYRYLMRRLREGRPWASHQLGVLLDTPEKIRGYLQVYLDFLDDMAATGFDPGRGKDPIGVAITRNGTIVKVNRGLHRLAMAQRLGLPSIPVQVRHVHRLWWEDVTAGATGSRALEKMAEALQRCVPEENPGPLDERPEVDLPPDFWPEPRVPA
ncbi:MAG TPA: hypothetical protein VKZ70_11570 [Burkholderiaceae bacterium]|nr:hypothetical protein [Burkholderiaceae bacterium]